MGTISERNERGILAATIEALVSAGYLVSVYDSAEVTVRRSVDRAEILAACMTTAEDHLYAVRPEEAGAGRSWVAFVYGNGNDGCDVLCDYTGNLEEILAPVHALAAGLCPHGSDDNEVTAMNALEYANKREHVIVRWAGVGAPAGTETFLGPDTELPFDLGEIPGHLRPDGAFEGLDLPEDLTDEDGNTIYAVWLREDKAEYDRLYADWEAAGGWA